MSRSGKVFRPGPIGNSGFYGCHTVGRRDAGGNSPRSIDGHGKGRPEAARIIFNHHGQGKRLNFFRGETQTNDAGTGAYQNIHLGWSEGFGGKNNVALVFSLLIVRYNYTLAISD
jgi:hypothetical protein